MATWTNIPDSVLEPGKPARSVDALALRDNPIAIAEGAAGAPKVTEGAMSTNSIHGNRIRTGSIAADRMVSGAAETNWVLGRTAGATAGAVGTYAMVYRALKSNSTGQVFWNGTTAGSTLRSASVTASWAAQGGAQTDPGALIGIEIGGALAGTWRIMGSRTGGTDQSGSAATLALRIA